MRISDWSSDVCSSDLILWLIWSETAPAEFGRDAGLLFGTAGVLALIAGGWSALRAPRLKTLVAYSTVAQLGYALLALGLLLHLDEPRLHAARSEEHTSELQSLMRISYAGFCLKKKKLIKKKKTDTNNKT